MYDVASTTNNALNGIIPAFYLPLGVFLAFFVIGFLIDQLGKSYERRHPAGVVE